MVRRKEVETAYREAKRVMNARERSSTRSSTPKIRACRKVKPLPKVLEARRTRQWLCEKNGEAKGVESADEVHVSRCYSLVCSSLLIDRRITVKTAVTVEDWPLWPTNWELKKQHSVEYWMMGTLLHDVNDREVVRVSVLLCSVLFFAQFQRTRPQRVGSRHKDGSSITVFVIFVNRSLKILLRSLKQTMGDLTLRNDIKGYFFRFCITNAASELTRRLNSKIFVVSIHGYWFENVCQTERYQKNCYLALTKAIKVFPIGMDKETLVLYAARASRTENQDAIDSSIVGMLSDPKEARAGITKVHFLPFNPVDKRTAITFIDNNGDCHRSNKGALEYGNSQVSAKFGTSDEATNKAKKVESSHDKN
ncbi:hypothetical protein V8G54_016293 [Vigna mungo]|uniref:Uncharacterized protein n=1 Tax=Vigna mungo TaxID=3915 RepID=A0AAQ3S0A9_VIGMU